MRRLQTAELNSLEQRIVYQILYQVKVLFDNTDYWHFALTFQEAVLER